MAPSSVVLALMAMALFLSWSGSAVASAFDHKYKDQDEVPLYANKVGPFDNPSETYRYFDLPFCRSENYNEKREDSGEVLNGDQLVHARYELNFKVDKKAEVLCKKTLTKEDLEKFCVADPPFVDSQAIVLEK